MTNPTYAGTAFYNRTVTVEPKRRRYPGQYHHRWNGTHQLRPREEWIPIAVPPVVSEEVQRRAIEQFHKNRWTSRRNTRRPYLLRTLVVCGECGRRMNAITEYARAGSHRYTYLYYMCAQSERNPEDFGRDYPCPARRVRADRLDAAVWESLCAWLQSPELVRKEMDLYQRDTDARSSGRAQERERWSRRRRELERQGQRLWDAYQAGLLPLEELRPRRERIERERSTVTTRMVEIDKVEKQRMRADELFRTVEAFCQRLRQGFEQLDFEGRQRVVRLIVERVLVKEGDVTIEHAIPLTGRFSELRPDHRVGVAPPEELRAGQLRPSRREGAEARPPPSDRADARTAKADPLVRRSDSPR